MWYALSYTLLAIFLGVLTFIFFAKPSLQLDERCRPILLPCSTFHSRFKPVLHAFRYPVLYIGVDLDTAGYSDAFFSFSSKAWRILSLHAADYLDHSDLSIKQKLWKCLESHGISTRNLRRAYLITTPRFLGYSFNPVSFHYIYDDKDELSIIVLEVNNTFDERHTYVLDQNATDDHNRAGYSASQTFARRFHVSPFNDRSGSYRLHSRDPFEDENIRIDMHLTLLSPEGSKKLTAQVNSIAPATPTRSPSTILVLLRYGSAVFLTVPRILFEAYKLHYSHKLGVYLRPEPFEDQSAIKRQSPSSSDEYFREIVVEYLRSLSEYSQIPCTIHILPSREKISFGTDGIEIFVLSWSFFTALVTSLSPAILVYTSKSLSTGIFRVSDEGKFLEMLESGFSGSIDGRWYATSLRMRYETIPPWFKVQGSSTNQGIDNFIWEESLRGQRSIWYYRYRVWMALFTTWLGNKAFDALATFTGVDGSPSDTWSRIERMMATEKES